MAQYDKVLHHVRIFWYFQDDVEMGQSTNLEKHLKIQGFLAFMAFIAFIAFKKAFIAFK